MPLRLAAAAAVADEPFVEEELPSSSSAEGRNGPVVGLPSEPWLAAAEVRRTFQDAAWASFQPGHKLAAGSQCQASAVRKPARE